MTQANMLLTISTLLLWMLSLVAATLCYYPNGHLANDIPCITGDAEPWCCGNDYACVSNGLCRDPNNTGTPDAAWPYLYNRCSCSNLSSPSCLNMCNAEVPNGNAAVWACNAEQTLFCCDNSGATLTERSCCNATDPHNFYTLEAPTLLPTTISSSTSEPSIASSPLGTSSSTINLASYPLSTSWPTSTTPFPLSTSSPTSPPSQTSSTSVGVEIGASVGVAVGVLLLTALGWLLWRRRKRQRGHQNESMLGEVDISTAIERLRSEQIKGELGGRAMVPQLGSQELYEL